jgi:hypothetical protein
VEAPARIEDFIRGLYDAFNARDIETALAGMHPDVDWPNMIDGGREHGHAAVRAYWERQFETTEPHVEPVQVTLVGDDEVVVDVHQVVRDKAGKVLADQTVQHVYELRDDLVERMDVRES